MSILWKKIEFYKGEKDREAIIIAAGGMGECCKPPQWGGFFYYMRPSHPLNFFPFPMKVLVSPIVTLNETLKPKKVIKNWTTKWVNYEEP